MAHLLRGVGVAIQQRERGQWDIVHSLWVVNAFILLAVNWWVTFDFQAHADEYLAAAILAGDPTPSFWTLEIFLTLLLWAVFLYMPSILLFPPDLEMDESHNQVYHRNRVWLMGSLIGWVIMEVAQTAMRGALLDPWFYLLFIGHWLVLFVLAMLVRRRGVQLFVAWWIFGSLLVWSFGVRRVLTAL